MTAACQNPCSNLCDGLALRAEQLCQALQRICIKRLRLLRRLRLQRSPCLSRHAKKLTVQRVPKGTPMS